MMESVINPETTVALGADVIERIESGKFELPLLPDVVWQVMELSTADDVDARKLSDLIHRDHALAGHVLRVANSPAYMPRMPIVSLQQAVSRLGIAQLSEITFAVSLQTRIFDAPGYEHEVRAIWGHTIGSAAYAKIIARKRRSNVEGAFLCGLLHDVGKPVILQALLDLQDELGLKFEPAAVSSLMEAHHTYVGSLVAAEWSLPPHVSESITYHHDYLLAPTCAEAVMVTRLADCLSYHVLMPEIFDDESVRQHPVLADLNFYPDDLDALLAERETVVRMIEAMS